MQRLAIIKKIAVIGAVAIVLGACGSDSDSDSDATTTTTAAASGATTTAAGTATTTGAGSTVDVPISGFAFNPSTLTIKAGTTVRWTNKDSATHTVTSGANRTSDGKFDHTLKTNETFEYTFTTAGTYEYYCRPHQAMVAKVIVQ